MRISRRISPERVTYISEVVTPLATIYINDRFGRQLYKPSRYYIMYVTLSGLGLVWLDLVHRAVLHASRFGPFRAL
jgi:hypothetical protein